MLPVCVVKTIFVDLKINVHLNEYEKYIDISFMF